MSESRTVEAEVGGDAPAGPAVRTAQASAAYFAVMLSFGLLLSPLRDLAVRSGAEPILAYLSQATVTLFGLTWAAGWVVQTFSVPSGAARRLGLGFGAVAALVATDLVASAFDSVVEPLDIVARLGRPEGNVILGAILLSGILPAVRHASGR